MATATVLHGGLRNRRQRMFAPIGLVAHWLILLGLVAVSLVAAIVLDQGSRLFLLKNVLAVTLSILPGSIYLLFISAKGQRLYDEFVINLYRLQIDRLGNLPAPPQHTTYFAQWKKANDAVKLASDTGTRDNLYRALSLIHI